MLLLLPVLAALLAATLRGGSPARLFTLHLRSGGVLALAFALQVFLYLPGVRGADLTLRWGPALYLVSLALAFIGIARNWPLGPPLRIALCGLGLNISAVALNGGHMPVARAALLHAQGPGAVRDLAAHRVFANVVLASPSSRVPALGDIIAVRIPIGAGNAYSIGDMLLCVGVGLLVYQVVAHPRGRTRSSDRTGRPVHA
jgi:hypothetical protein